MPVIQTTKRPPPALANTSLSIACDTCAVRAQSICATLTHPELVQLNAISQFKDFDAGQTILRDGEHQNFFATVVTGTIKLTKSLPDGRQQIVGLQFPSDFLGRPWRQTSPYDATAATDVKLCLFSRAKFEGLTKINPSLDHRLLAHTLDDLDTAQEWLLILGRKTATEKVASLLAMIARRLVEPAKNVPSGTPCSVEFELPLTRAEMADCLGLTLETVCRQMTKFKTNGLVDHHGGRTIRVRDLNQLDSAAGSVETSR